MYKSLHESAENTEQEVPITTDTDSDSPLSSVPMPTPE